MQKTGREFGDYILAATTETDKKGMIKKVGAINVGFFPRKPDWPVQYPSVVIQVDDIKEAMRKVTYHKNRIILTDLSKFWLFIYQSEVKFKSFCSVNLQ